MDGHFWVVRNGEIIDPYFKYYDYVKNVNGLEGDRKYIPAPELIQKVMKKKFIEAREETLNWRLEYQPGFKLSSRIEDCCNFNAILEVRQNGGEIVFGSMGWKKKNGDGVWWEYGGEGYTIKQFINK